MSSTEKLTATRAQLELRIEELLSTSDGGMAAQMALAFIRPQVEAKVDELLARPADDIDEFLVAVIDIIARHISDDYGAFVAGPYGVEDLLERADADPLRAPDPVGGGNPIGQVGARPQDVPVGGGAAVGDRPG